MLTNGAAAAVHFCPSLASAYASWLIHALLTRLLTPLCACLPACLPLATPQLEALKGGCRAREQELTAARNAVEAARSAFKAHEADYSRSKAVAEEHYMLDEEDKCVRAGLPGGGARRRGWG